MRQTQLKRFTIAEYHRLTEIGFFTEDDRIELIRGEIMQMAAKGMAHSTCCRNLLRELSLLVALQATLQCQDPITLGDNSEPEPDFAILRTRADNYLSAHPGPGDILLVIEVSDSTLNYDREVKRILYAEAQISDYWIVNLLDLCLEVYCQPYQTLQGSFDYGFKQVLLPNQVVSLPQVADVSLELARIFPTSGKLSNLPGTD